MSKTAEPTPPTTGNVKAAPVGQAISRMKMLAILGAFALPLLLASLWLYFVRAGGGELGISARGELIRPAFPLEPFTLEELDAGSFDRDALRGIWTLFYAPVGECVDTCQKNLYHMRQVRLSLAHRMDRVQRVVLIEQQGQLAPELIAEHPGLRVLSGQRAALMEQVGNATRAMDARIDAMYLIDPYGNLMMRFPADLPPKSMLKDIKHLLKVSRIG